APGQRQPFPEWAELVPGVIWIYDFTHFRAAKRCAVAVLDVVSRYWLSSVVSAEESSTQIEVAFTRALVADGKEHLLDEQLLAELSHGVVPDDDDDRVPVLLAVTDTAPPHDRPGYRGVHGRGPHRPALRTPPGHPERPGLGRVVLRPPQGREPAPGAHRRPRRARSRTDPAARPLQHRAAPRRHRLRHPRRRTHRPRTSHPRRPPSRPERRSPSQSCVPPATTPRSFIVPVVGYFGPHLVHFLRHTSDRRSAPRRREFLMVYSRSPARPRRPWRA